MDYGTTDQDGGTAEGRGHTWLIAEYLRIRGVRGYEGTRVREDEWTTRTTDHGQQTADYGLRTADHGLIRAAECGMAAEPRPS
jgi:hypothetical protein